MRYSLESRCRIVRLILAGASPQAAAAACGASRATGYRLWRRYLADGWPGLVDRPSTPKRQPRRCSRELEQRILAARAYAKAGPLTVAGQLGLPASTVWKVLRRHGVSRLQLPAREPTQRYERSRPGELVHVDIKKLGRIQGGAGWRVRGGGQHYNPKYTDRAGKVRHSVGYEYVHVHVAVDDHIRLAYTKSSPTRKRRGRSHSPPRRHLLRTLRRTRRMRAQ
jgi:transposase-like protein